MNGGQRKAKRGTRVLFAIVLIVVIGVSSFSVYLGVSASVEGRSVGSKFFDLNIDIFMTGDRYVSPEKTLQKVEKRRVSNEKYSIPTVYSFLFGFDVATIGGLETAVFSGNERSDQAIVFFHGGSYMWQPTVFHFWYCRRLADALGTTVVMPIYPKAPNYTYRECLPALKSFYLAYAGNKEIVAFFGDSSGGGLLLSFSQYLVDNGFPIPDNLVTFSPCLDLSLENPEIADYTAADPMLNRADLRLKFSFYADGDYDSAYVSPLYCDYNTLGRWTCFVGSEEILYPDAELLHEILTERGIDHDFYFYRNQFHTFAIFPIPESDTILGICRNLLFPAE